MDEDLKRKALEMAAAEGIELSDEMLDAIAGGYIYHDEGDPAAHRKEAFYVLDGNGTVVMRLDNVTSARHWAGNLRTSADFLTPEQFERLRRHSS
ncbi:MAG: hypothetical protein IJM67_07585 [Atopobiaceae bacterium]|nr:hypothetical protein [Atopobiaceae bacterium]MBR3385174.1 hypothetical protein [Atopobiaceae bacterium]